MSPTLQSTIYKPKDVMMTTFEKNLNLMHDTQKGVFDIRKKSVGEIKINAARQEGI